MLPQFFGMYAVRSKAMDERITTADGKTKKHAVAKQRMYWVVMTNILASKLKVGANILCSHLLSVVMTDACCSDCRCGGVTGAREV
jgi:hypothetical protein